MQPYLTERLAEEHRQGPALDSRAIRPGRPSTLGTRLDLYRDVCPEGNLYMTSEGLVPAGGPAGRSPPMSVEQAQRQAGRGRGFYTQVLVFVLGNTARFVVNGATLGNGGHRWRLQWALVAWPAAPRVHAVTVVGRQAWFGADWEDSKVSSKATGPPREPGSGEPSRSVDVVQFVCGYLTEPPR